MLTWREICRVKFKEPRGRISSSSFPGSGSKQVAPVERGGAWGRLELVGGPTVVQQNINFDHECLICKVLTNKSKKRIIYFIAYPLIILKIVGNLLTCVWEMLLKNLIYHGKYVFLHCNLWPLDLNHKFSWLKSKLIVTWQALLGAPFSENIVLCCCWRRQFLSLRYITPTFSEVLRFNWNFIRYKLLNFVCSRQKLHVTYRIRMLAFGLLTYLFSIWNVVTLNKCWMF